MADLLANRRIPGEQRRSLIFSLSELNHTQPISDDDDGEAGEGDEGSEASAVSSDAALIGGGASTTNRPRTTPTSRHELATKVQSLKDEFTDLLTEIRRRKSVTEGGGGVGIGVQTEFEEDDGEIRRPRKRALSTTSTWSSSSGREVSSCMARPLTTPTQMGPPLLAPTTPTMPIKGGGRSYLVTDIP
ncbi:uncharacterized protein LOC125033580 isoform X2 [Penaeus chinensis]|uniref:uncharacterized protein LOC125033580 isoform X2 n=1 Tax=Penaeus chinensis TaxID=139456 RepID=UPI001FB74EB5|nr:uncharacterized protein LOC125033580 isoform X2 [Penaeus chinensis]